LAAAVSNFTVKCIDGLTATDNGPKLVERGLALCTALVPAVGYDIAAAIAHEAYTSGKTVREIAREKTKLSEEELTTLLDPMRMTAPDKS
jgi:fumarate hydratase class II